MPSWLTRVLSWIAAALVGVVYGAAGTIAHSLMWGPIPVGLIVGAIACGSVLIAVRVLTHDRAAAVATSIGLIGTLMLISGPGPGGSVIVPNTPVGVVWIYLIAGIALLVTAWPSFKNRSPRHRAAGTPAATGPTGPGEGSAQRDGT